MFWLCLSVIAAEDLLQKIKNGLHFVGEIRFENFYAISAAASAALCESLCSSISMFIVS